MQEYENVADEVVDVKDKLKYFLRGIREDSESELWRQKQDREIREQVWTWTEISRLCNNIKKRETTQVVPDEQGPVGRPSGRARNQLRAVQALPPAVRNVLTAEGNTMDNLRTLFNTSPMQEVDTRNTYGDKGGKGAYPGSPRGH